MTNGQQFVVYIFVVFAIMLIASMWIVYGDDTEDNGTPTLNEQLLERAREWNIQKVMNDTLAMAERFNCDYDESLCVLGIPDPDFCTGNMTKMDRDICND